MTQEQKLAQCLELFGKICGIQSNLLSTAPEQEKDEFIALIYQTWNEVAVPLMENK